MVCHETEYRYSEPVSFGRHRMMFRPRDSHSLRVLATSLTISPEPTSIKWIYDAFGNSIAYAEFGAQQATTLRFVSTLKLHHYETPQPMGLLDPAAARYPFAYSECELPNLSPLIRMQRPDPAGRITAWATAVVGRARSSTHAILSEMMVAIRRDVRYRRRFQSGTQDPAVTLTLGTGTCRDFALLMIEALRSLGFAARFVSGYIYNPHRLNYVGGGATHAWVQVYLPGCGWIDLDPTNGIFGNRDLIRVGVARDHAQALPLSGTYCGRRGAYLGMSVSVSVTQGENHD